MSEIFWYCILQHSYRIFWIVLAIQNVHHVLIFENLRLRRVDGVCPHKKNENIGPTNAAYWSGTQTNGGGRARVVRGGWEQQATVCRSPSFRLTPACPPPRHPPRPHQHRHTDRRDHSFRNHRPPQKNTAIVSFFPPKHIAHRTRR